MLLALGLYNLLLSLRDRAYLAYVAFAATAVGAGRTLRRSRLAICVAKRAGRNTYRFQSG